MLDIHIVVMNSTHVHRLYFTSSDEESTTQLAQFMADEGDPTDQEEASS